MAGRNRQEGAGRSQEPENRTPEQRHLRDEARKEQRGTGRAVSKHHKSSNQAAVWLRAGDKRATSGQELRLTGRTIRRERRSAAQEERRASGKEHQRTCTSSHLCRWRRRKQQEGQDPRQRACRWLDGFPYKTDDRNCWKIV